MKSIVHVRRSNNTHVLCGSSVVGLSTVSLRHAVNQFDHMTTLEPICRECDRAIADMAQRQETRHYFESKYR